MHIETHVAQRDRTMPRASVADTDLPSACRSCTVRHLSVCASLERAEMRALGAAVAQSRYERGATIMIEGEAADHLSSIVHGTVKIFRLLPDGRRQITGFLTAGDFLGLVLADHHPYSAEAVDDVTLCRIPRERFERLLGTFPQLARSLLRNASTELFAAQDQMLLLGRKTAREKLASFLVTSARRAAVRGGADDVVRLTMTRTDIGDYLGLTIETVSRTLTQLRQAGILALHGINTVEILDRDALEAAAEG